MSTARPLPSSRPLTRSRLCGLLAGLAATPALALAQDAPPEPRTGELDWVQLANGEWFRGEIDDLLDDDFEFESDELDTLSLDWADVHLLFSDRVNTVVLRDRSTVEGRLRIEGDEVRVLTPEGEVTYARDELRGIIPGEQTEANYWSGGLSAGLTLRSGNVDQVDATWSLSLERRDALSRLTLDYDGAYSEVDGDRTADNHRGLVNYDSYLTERLFLRPIRVEYYRDEFQNIDHRLTPGAGAGYDVINEGDWDWTVFGGAGWQFTEFVEAPPGEPSSEDFVVATAGTRVEWEVNAKVDAGLEFDITVPVEDADSFSSRTKLYTEVELASDLDLEVQFIWDRVNDPEPLADGTMPESDELRLFVGVGWDF